MNVVDLSTGWTGSASQDPLHENGAADLQVQHQRLPQRKLGAEENGLVQSARKTVEDRTVFAIGLTGAGDDGLANQAVGDELAGAHLAPDHSTQFCVFLSGLAQDIAGRDVG